MFSERVDKSVVLWYYWKGGVSFGCNGVDVREWVRHKLTVCATRGHLTEQAGLIRWGPDR